MLQLTERERETFENLVKEKTIARVNAAPKSRKSDTSYKRIRNDFEKQRRLELLRQKCDEFLEHRLFKTAADFQVAINELENTPVGGYVCRFIGA